MKEKFRPPLFDFYYNWKVESYKNCNLYEHGGTRPVDRTTTVLWKSDKYSGLKKKTYNYQLD